MAEDHVSHWTSQDVLFVEHKEATRRESREAPRTIDLAPPRSSWATPSGTGANFGPFLGPKGTKYRHVDATGADVDARPTPGDEIGTLYDRDRLFAFYEAGKTFQDPLYTVADIETMLNTDGKGAGLEQALTLPLRMAPYHMEGQKGDKGELEMCQEQLLSPPAQGGMLTPMDSVIASMASGSMFKRAHFERVYDEKDSKLRLRKLAYRMPSTCYLARDANTGHFAGFLQWTWKNEAFQRFMIPANKAFVFIHGQHRNSMEGISDLSLAYQIFLTKQKLRFLWLQYLETVSLPRALAVHHNQNMREAQNFARNVANLKRGGVIGLLQGQEVKTFESQRGGQAEFREAMNYLDSEQSGSVLAGFLDLTGAAASLGRGSMALSQDQSRFYLQMRQAVLGEMATAITYGTPDGCPGIVSDLCRWNYGVDAKVPRFMFGSLLQTDIVDKTVGLLQAIASAPTVNLPYAFIDMIIEKTAGYLGLDVDAVVTALQASDHKPSDTPAELAARTGMNSPLSPVPQPKGMNDGTHQVVSAVARAHEMVQRHLVASTPGGNGNGAAAA